MSFAPNITQSAHISRLKDSDGVVRGKGRRGIPAKGALSFPVRGGSDLGLTMCPRFGTVYLTSDLV